MNQISKRAKVVSDTPAYTEKEKSESGGTIYRYDEGHIAKRWKCKTDKLKLLEKNIEKLRTQYEKDLGSDDLRTQAEAAVVGILDDTAMRVGNESSVKEFGSYGATTLKVKHLTFSGSKTTFKFVGKDQVKQDVSTSNSKITKVLKELTKGKKDDDFVFEIGGTKIWDRAINRYLEKFDISAKDLRGFQANRIMKEKLKHKDFKEALEETAKEVGHESATLKNQYLDPSLVEKYTKKDKKADFIPEISKRARLTSEDAAWLSAVKPDGTSVTPSPSAPASTQKKQLRIQPGVKLNQLILDAWRTLLPFLPASAVMTSGARTPDDQKRILREYWQISGLTPQSSGFGDYFTMSRVLKQRGYIVGPPASKDPYGHLNGSAIDIAGADLDEITEAIRLVSEHQDLPVRFTSPLVERNNKDVHIGIMSAQYDPTAIAKVLQEMRVGENRIASDKSTTMKKISIRYDDNIIREEPMSSKVRQILYDVSDDMTAEKDSVLKGVIVISEDPSIKIRWYFLNNKERPSTSHSKYQAYAILEKRLPDFTNQETIFDMEGMEPVELAKKMIDTITSSNFHGSLVEDLTYQLQQKQLEHKDMRSLNVEDISSISKTAAEAEVESVLEDLGKSDVPEEVKKEFIDVEQKADDKLKIEIGPDEQKVFDLLKEVKAYYKLPIKLYCVGGFVRDSVMKKLENK